MAMNSIPTNPTGSIDPDRVSLDDVCDMEEPLSVIHDLLTGIMYAGEAISDGGAAIARIAEIARDECEKVASLRATLFHDLHPNVEGAAQ